VDKVERGPRILYRYYRMHSLARPGPEPEPGRCLKESLPGVGCKRRCLVVTLQPQKDEENTVR
jgi:hypothetical protein